MRRLVRGSFWLRGLFLEAADAPVLVGFDDAELLRGFRSRDFDGSDRNIGSRIDVLLKHFGVIHFVDMVAGENEHELGTLAPDRVNILIHRVGGPLIPLLGHTHLRRKNFDVFTKPHER